MSDAHASRVEIVLRAANWGGDVVAAGRILAQWPEVATDNFYIAVATGNLARVERDLAADPALARCKGGALDWEPLLYLAYSRLPGSESNGVAIATLLLDGGADPNANWNDGWDNAFTALTGVIGEGEGDRLPHPQAKALAALLIERGADPFDTQALYNTSITRDDTTWLDFLWQACERRGLLEYWRGVPESKRIGGKVSLSALDYLLGNAVAYNHLARASWLLDHGANSKGVHAYSTRPLREEALLYGHREMAALLEKSGAQPLPLEGQAAFQAACMALDREAARAVLNRHPECLRNAEPMLIAARAGRADVVALLLELGMDVDVADKTKLRGLQNAVAGGSLEVVKLLVAHGADVDRPTVHFGGALGFASHFGRREIAAFLAPMSRDVWNLTHLGIRSRLVELFSGEPGLVNARHPKFGLTPLFCLPDDEHEAVEMARLLLAHGADVRITNKDGLAPEQSARNRGLHAAADLMRR